MLPKSAAAADEVFPHAALRFVYTQRNRDPRGQTVVIRRQALFVQTVPCFVQNAEECLVEMAFVVARRDSAVVRAGLGAEGMRGNVEPAAVEVEAERGGNVLAE